MVSHKKNSKRCFCKPLSSTLSFGKSSPSWKLLLVIGTCDNCEERRSLHFELEDEKEEKNRIY